MARDGLGGFQPNVDGFYDVHAELPRYFRQRLERQLRAGDRRRARIDSREALNQHRQQMRRQLVTTVGGLFERTPLNTMRTGAFERTAHAVETVVFESLPDVHVTANCYRPVDSSEPVPGVLFLCGHAPAGKAAPAYQRACIELARNGCAVLAVDPIGQGERQRATDRANPNTSPVTIHTRLGGGCTLAGTNLARYLIWDAIRSLDVLQSFPFVAADQLGVLGNSGGGLQTAYCMLLDDRVATAMPCSFVTAKGVYAKTGQAQDAEQILPDAVRVGPRYDDFLTSFAPKPLCIGTSQSDFLPIAGAQQSYERARTAYALYDATKSLALVVSDSTHGLGPTLRTAAVNWFRHQLLDESTAVSPRKSTVESEATLACLREDSVFEAFASERGVSDLTAETVRSLHPTTPATTTRPYAETLRKRIRSRFELDRTRPSLSPRRLDTETADGLVWEKLFFESEDDVHTTAIAVRTPGTAPSCPTIVVLDRGTAELPEYRDDVAALARNRGFVLVFDPRGMGGVRARPVNTPQNNGGEYFDIHGTVYKLASDALMTGCSLLGLRVFDVVRAREYCAERFDQPTVGLVGAGIGAFYALFAAVSDLAFEPVCVEAVPPFYERATTPETVVNPGLLCYGVIGSLDVPQLMAALTERDVRRVDFPEDGLAIDSLT